MSRKPKNKAVEPQAAKPQPRQIQDWAIDKLKPYAANSRTHSKEQVQQIAASIIEFGWTNPVLADPAGEVIAGHGRLEAAKLLGLETVPVLVLDDLDQNQRKALRIADNKLALNAGWNEEALAAELKALELGDYDLAFTGFSEIELKKLFGDSEGVEGENDTPELPEEPETNPGDLYIMGEHRLLCGDSTNADDVARLLDGAKPHLMVTDPPYGVSYRPEWRNEADGVNRKRTGKVQHDDKADWREAWALFPGSVAYVWLADRFSGVVAESLEARGFRMRCQIIWKKARFALGRGDYQWGHEPCWYAVKDKQKSHWQGARDQSTVWDVAPVKDPEGEDAATHYGTQKPVEIMRRPLVNNSRKGDSVYEPFAGSGSTLIAAETVGRKCLAMELDPGYCDVIVQRWENLTGQKAQRIPAQPASEGAGG